MIKKPAVPRGTKATKAPKEEEELCSRVGKEYQVRIPPFRLKTPEVAAEPNEIREVPVWNPSKAPAQSDLDLFFEKATMLGYKEEAARTFLHWHQYNLEKATIDLPNYVPIANRWSQSELKRFLKFVEAKSRKDFASLKRAFPKHDLHEVAALYYQIAAPMKNQTKIGRRNENDIKQHLEKANELGILIKSPEIKSKFAQSAHSPFCVTPLSQQPKLALGVTRDGLERALENHLVNLLGVQETRRVLNRLMLNRALPVEELIDPTYPPDLEHAHATANRSTTKIFPADANYLNGMGNHSDSSSSHMDTESTSQGQNGEKYTLPTNIHYEHADFANFIMQPDETADAKADESGEATENLLKSQSKLAEEASRILLGKVEQYKPPDGFPKISFRWTKKELAVTLTALSHLGTDFVAIAKLVGTKSESFLRDWYHRWCERYNLDALCPKQESTTARETLRPPSPVRPRRAQGSTVVQTAVSEETKNEAVSPPKKTASTRTSKRTAARNNSPPTTPSSPPAKRQSKRQIVPSKRHLPLS